MAADLQTTYLNEFSLMKIFTSIIKISLKFVPKGQIDTKSSLVQLMTVIKF